MCFYGRLSVCLISVFVPVLFSQRSSFYVSRRSTLSSDVEKETKMSFENVSLSKFCLTYYKDNLFCKTLKKAKEDLLIMKILRRSFPDTILSSFRILLIAMENEKGLACFAFVNTKQHFFLHKHFVF